MPRHGERCVGLSRELGPWLRGAGFGAKWRTSGTGFGTRVAILRSSIGLRLVLQRARASSDSCSMAHMGSVSFSGTLDRPAAHCCSR
eukprot:7923657-Alexandrium_andersonii.AAC.1